MHNHTFKAFSIPSCYSKSFLASSHDLKRDFLNSGLDGANITVPHKEEAFRICDVLDDRAKIIGAVNTIVNKNGKIYGYNTDAPGFLKSIQEYKNINNVLILGAGGTAKAISIELKEVFKVTVLNRSNSREEFFVKNSINYYSWESFKYSDYDLIINTTSAGLIDNLLPLDKELLNKLFQNTKYAVDVIYGKLTPFLILAKKNNLIYKDGKDMLVSQGAIAFDIFTNHKYDIDKIRAEMDIGLNLPKIK